MALGIHFGLDNGLGAAVEKPGYQRLGIIGVVAAAVGGAAVVAGGVVAGLATSSDAPEP